MYLLTERRSGKATGGRAYRRGAEAGAQSPASRGEEEVLGGGGQEEEGAGATGRGSQAGGGQETGGGSVRDRPNHRGSPERGR